VGLATVKTLKVLLGPGCFMENACCGLLCYNYGELNDARTLARKNIEKAQGMGGSMTPIVGDCSSCVAFLKSYPQLFLEDPEWRTQAESFASRVQDAVVVFDREGVPLQGVTGPVVYHESCRACHGQGLKPPEKLLRSALGTLYRKLAESDVCCGGAGAFCFVHPELSEEVLLRKIGHIAETQARLVLTSSTSCLIQLAHGLKKYYPDGRVMHISELAAQVLEEASCNGTPSGA
jgi:glycolate oxidase iron-sulfur subunit